MTSVLTLAIGKFETPNWATGGTLPSPYLQDVLALTLETKEAVTTCFRNPDQRGVLTAHAMPRLSVQADQSNHQSVTGPPVVPSVSLSLESSRLFLPLASVNCPSPVVGLPLFQSLSVDCLCPWFCCCPSAFVC